MKNEVYIESSSTLSSVEYDIVVGHDGKDCAVVARCWDCLLADRIRDAVENYMKENYKINSEEI